MKKYLIAARTALQRSLKNRQRIIVSCSYEGNTFFYPNDDDIGKLIASGHGWDGNVRIILSEMVHETTPFCVDIGANIGATLMQIKLAKPGSEVYCFEPSSRFRDILKRNIEVNDWPGIHVTNLGLSDKAQHLTLYSNEITASVVTKEYDNHTFFFQQKIDATTFDLYWEDKERLDFIKSDTDGYDYTILQGAAKTLSKFKPLLFFEFQVSQIVPNGQRPEDFIDFLIGLGYNKFLLFNNFGTPLAISKDARDIMRIYKDPDLDVRFMDILAVHGSKIEQSRKMDELFRNLTSGKIQPVVRKPINRLQARHAQTSGS